MVDNILTAITLAIAVIGTLWDSPGRRVKATLVLLAVAASGAAIWKSSDDDRQKKFVEAALISSLNPTASDFKKIHSAIDKIISEKKIDGDVRYTQTQQGMTMTVENQSSIFSVTVFDRADLSTLFASIIQGKFDKSLVIDRMERTYSADDPDDDLMERIGILGFSVIRNQYGYDPDWYIYDTRSGIYWNYQQENNPKRIDLNISELSDLKSMPAHDLFVNIAHIIQEKLKQNEKPSENKPSIVPSTQQNSENRIDSR